MRRELRQVNRYGNQVFVDAHWIKSVANYQAITRGADVEQSPTVVVADANLKAETLVGYVDHETINQAVVDAIRASGGSLIKNPYFRQLDAICTSAEQQIKALQQPASAAAIPAYLVGVQGVTTDVEKKVNGVKPPKKWRNFHKDFKLNVAGHRQPAHVGRGQRQDGARPRRSRRSRRPQQAPDKKFVKENGAHGLSCF